MELWIIKKAGLKTNIENSLEMKTKEIKKQKKLSKHKPPIKFDIPRIGNGRILIWVEF